MNFVIMETASRKILRNEQGHILVFSNDGQLKRWAAVNEIDLMQYRALGVVYAGAL